MLPLLNYPSYRTISLLSIYLSACVIYASIRAKISGKVSDAGPFNAQTSPMMMTILYEGASLGSIQMPELDLKVGEASFNLETPFNITDPIAFERFSTVLVSEEAFTWTMVGNCSLNVMGMQLNDLKFNKRVYLAGKLFINPL
jgi:hypothetical protein